MDAKVGIVTINWNGYALTVRCVSSILAQQYPFFHIYVVDNASDHDEGRRLTELYRTDPRVTVIPNPSNDGYAGGNNVGIDRAQIDGYGQGIFCINNDATLEAGGLSALISAAAADSKIGLIGSRIFYPDRRMYYALAGATFNPWTGIDHLVGARRVAPSPAVMADTLGYISGAAVFITSSGLSVCSGFDPDYFLYCEELDLALRIRRAGLRLAYVPTAMVIHDSAATTRHMSPTYVYYFLRNRLLVLRKQLAWYYWPSYLAVYFGYYVLGFMVVLVRQRNLRSWPLVFLAVTDAIRHHWGHRSL